MTITQLFATNKVTDFTLLLIPLPFIKTIWKSNTVNKIYEWKRTIRALSVLLPYTKHSANEIN